MPSGVPNHGGVINPNNHLLDHNHGVPCYLPDANEIAAACAEIQAGWSPVERYRRQMVKPVPVNVAPVHMVGVSARPYEVAFLPPEPMSLENERRRLLEGLE